jgi:hypothetical protein
VGAFELSTAYSHQQSAATWTLSNMQTANLHMPRASGVTPLAKRGSRLIAKTATLEPSTQVQHFEPQSADGYVLLTLMAANGESITQQTMPI